MARPEQLEIVSKPTSLRDVVPTATLDRIAARALCGAGIMTRSAIQAPWSDATRERLYSRMFPDEATS